MRTQRTRLAVVAGALLAVLAWSAAASATTTGIEITEPPLVAQRGSFRFTGGFEVILCNAVLAKTMVNGLVMVQSGVLTKIGRVVAGRLLECNFASTLLNLPGRLGDGEPGPNAESWNVTFLSSNLVEGQMNFGILDFQLGIIMAGGLPCLYRGPLLGTLSRTGRVLRYASSIPLSNGFGCPAALAVEGTFTNEPPIRYTLLVT